jgi:hypothetical protein
MLAEVVGIGAVDNRIESALAGDLVQSGPQLGFAEIAAFGGVTEIPRILELVCLDF